jgi:hypothetical protein
VRNEQWEEEEGNEQLSGNNEQWGEKKEEGRLAAPREGGALPRFAAPGIVNWSLFTANFSLFIVNCSLLIVLLVMVFFPSFFSPLAQVLERVFDNYPKAEYPNADDERPLGGRKILIRESFHADIFACFWSFAYCTKSIDL